MTDKITKSEQEWQKQLTPSSTRFAGKKAQNVPLPGNIGTATSPGHIAASAAELHCLIRIANLIPVPAGPLSGSRWNRITLRPGKTTAFSHIGPR
jgi:hypothetical protein